MSTIRKRSWTAPTGEAKTAWQVDYRDGAGVRRSKQFARKKDAEAWLTTAAYEVSRGVHTADSQSVSVNEAITRWLGARKSDGVERSTLDAYERIARLHISPLLGTERLNRLTKPGIEQFKKTLIESGRTKAQASRALSHLSMVITEAERMGSVAHNVSRGVRVTRNSRDDVELEIPAPDELRRLIDHSGPELRAFVMTAALAGLRASELRGLMWDDVDLTARTLKIARRADDRNVLGPPKSGAGRRSIPLSPKLLAELRAWKLRCPPTDLDLVFPSPRGVIWTYKNLTERAYFPLQVKAGLTEQKRDGQGAITLQARYGLHALRHAAASLWIRQGIDLMRLKTWMGHAHVQTTIDTYGHLLHDHLGDAELIAKAEKALLG